MTAYGQGYKFELLVRDYFVAKGYQCIRSAGSKGIVDLIVWKTGDGEQTQVIQCKKETVKKSYEEDVLKMKLLPVPVGWKKRLWVKRGKEIWVHDLTEGEFGVKVRTVKDVNQRIKELQNA